MTQKIRPGRRAERRDEAKKMMRIVYVFAIVWAFLMALFILAATLNPEAYDHLGIMSAISSFGILICSLVLVRESRHLEAGTKPLPDEWESEKRMREGDAKWTDRVVTVPRIVLPLFQIYLAFVVILFTVISLTGFARALTGAALLIAGIGGFWGYIAREGTISPKGVHIEIEDLETPRSYAFRVGFFVEALAFICVAIAIICGFIFFFSLTGT